MKRFRLKEYLTMYWDTPLLDFKKLQAHMEWHIEERKYLFFWKTKEIFKNQNLAEQKFEKFYKIYNYENIIVTYLGIN
jgi:hypothetical protein